MKILKMSLVAAVAVAGLSTVSFADVKISGKTDFRWKSQSTGDADKNGLTRGRVDMHVKAPSKDGMGKAHFAVRYDGTSKGSAINVLKAYADYKLGMVTLGVGPKIGFPGNFSFSTVQGVTVATKVAGFNLGVGIADQDTGMEDKEKLIVTANGKVAIATLRFDYNMGNQKKGYLATDAKVKVGPATITAGYVAGMGDNNEDTSVMGADVAVGLGMVTVHGAFSMSGEKTAGQITENGDDGRAIGSIAGAMGKKVTAMQFGVAAKVAGIAVQGNYSMATPDGGDASNKIYLDAKKSLNAQSTANVRYYINTPAEGDATNTIELRFASKF